MQAKLHINIPQGIIDIEGEPKFVMEIYSDFKGQLLSQLKTPADSSLQSGGHSNKSEGKGQPKKRTPPRKKTKPEADNTGIDADSPQLDKELDTSGLADFYNQFELKNNAEKILVFSKFLIEQRNIENPNTNQFYTCYWDLKETIPKVFSQAFRDAHGRNYGYINYNSSTDIKITTLGTNYFNRGLKRKADE